MSSMMRLLDDARLHVNACCSRFESWQLVAMSVVGTFVVMRTCEFFAHNDEGMVQLLKRTAFRALVRVPGIRGVAEKEMATASATIDKHCARIFAGEKYVETLPEIGQSEEGVVKEVARYLNLGRVHWDTGKVSGAVYADVAHMTHMAARVYELTAFSNPLHPEVFPGINKMEAEVVRMTCTLFNGDDDSCGSLTSGGTESIILAVKAARDYGRATRGISRAEIVVPRTAHAAFTKAAQMLDMRVRMTALEPDTWKADVRAMERACNKNTVLIVGSACGYPHGIIDDIDAIAKVALSRGVLFHVDSCLGGFLLPFMEHAPVVDFRVRGVTSISADTHKYGFAPKGSSVLMFRNQELRSHQYSVQSEWPGGIYASPTIAGSRAGANIATCWATMMLIGREGYVRATKEIIDAAMKLKRELKKVKGIFIFGDPQMSVVALGSKEFNIFTLSDALGKRGWALNPLQLPPGVHLCVTLMHTKEGVIEELIKDVEECTRECLKNKSTSSDGMGAVYGMAETIPDKDMVASFAKRFLDSMYNTKW